MRIPYFSKPLVFSVDGLLLEYDYKYDHPKKHYRLDPKLWRVFKEISMGYEFSDTGYSLEGIPFEALEYINLPLPDRADRMIVDGSIGGPSYWGRDCHWLFHEHGFGSIFISFSFKQVIIGSKTFDLPECLSKYSYSQIFRSIVKNVVPDNLLVVGREVASKLCDIKGTRVLVETGFGESDLLHFEQNMPEINDELVKRALTETLFRNHTYPWDSLSHLICASEAVKGSKINVIWSEFAAERAKKAFKSSTIIAQLPSFHLPSIVASSSGLRILASTGSHIIGDQTIRFLSIDVLCQLVKSLKNLQLVLISRFPERLEHFKCENISVEKIGDRQDSIQRYRQCDIFFRVQNDSSLPMSCLEAMALEKVVIINEAAGIVSKQLRHQENVLFTRYGDISSLSANLRFIVQRRPQLRKIGKSARQLAQAHCNIENNLRALSLI